MSISRVLPQRLLLGLVAISLLTTLVEAKEYEKEVELCPRYLLRGRHVMSFKEPERLLICGDPKNPAWKEIPENQAMFHLRTFLQQRGYNNPRFEKRDDKIIIDIGEPTRVTRFFTDGDPAGFDLTRFRHIEGEVLTPGLLDEVKARMILKLQSIGFACPQVETEASTTTGELVAHLKTGTKQNLVAIGRDPVAGMNSEVFGRYDAFLVGKPYNGDYLAVTVHRILDQGMVQSVFFTTRCEANGAEVTEHFVPGPARVVSFGVGVSTEEFVQGRASWKNSRLGATSSIISLEALGSFKRQQFSADVSWYVLPEPSRFYLRPSFTIQHENLDPYESISSQLRLAPAWTTDTETMYATYYLGPTLNLTHTVRGLGPDFSKFLSLGGELRLTDHYYEFYRASPRRGYDIRVEGNFSQNNWLSNLSAQLVRVGFEKLWNLSHWDPPVVVLGLRGRLATTFTAEDVNTSTLLPVDFRQFLGGSTDLRGFGLRQLPGTNGSLTAIYLGAEARFADFLPWHLQPLVFLDGGAFGSRPFSLDGAKVYSPGVGVRWESQIGVIRTTFSHGLFLHRPAEIPETAAHWQFYFSFGEEF